jgi:hypothetical protein
MVAMRNLLCRLPASPSVAAPKSSTATVSSFTLTPPSFVATMEVDLRVYNPSYLAIGWESMDLYVWHHCCDTPIAHITNSVPATIPGRGTEDVLLNFNMDSSSSTQWSTCAAEVVGSSACNLLFNGTISPIYLATTFPPVFISFQ